MTSSKNSSKPSQKRRPKELSKNRLDQSAATLEIPGSPAIEATSNSGAAPDPFDPESLRLTDTNDFGVEKILTVVPVRKPGKQEWVRVHPAPDYRMTTAVLTDEQDRDQTYMVSPDIRESLVGEFIPVNLITAINRHGALFLWQLKISTDGRSNPWHESANAAALLAEKEWVRMKSNMAARCYEVAKATGPIPEPEWPELQFKEILRIAFQNRFVDSVDHPVLKSLRGEV